MNQDEKEGSVNEEAYVLSWQKPVGWLCGEVPFDIADPRLMEVAKKILFYMKVAEARCAENASGPPIPMAEGFYHMQGGKEAEHCTIENCGQLTAGAYGFGIWCFPVGLVHFMKKHGYKPPDDFLRDLAMALD